MGKFYLFFLSTLLLTTGCVKKPFACFRTTSDPGDIRVNQPVTFVAACSNNANDYYWQFYDDPDSVAFGYTATRTFYDTGEVKVFLLVTAGRNASSSSETIYVLP